MLKLIRGGYMNIVSHNWKRKKENNIEGASARSVLRRPFRNEKQGEISKKNLKLMRSKRVYFN